MLNGTFATFQTPCHLLKLFTWPQSCWGFFTNTELNGCRISLFRVCQKSSYKFYDCLGAEFLTPLQMAETCQSLSVKCTCRLLVQSFQQAMMPVACVLPNRVCSVQSMASQAVSIFQLQCVVAKHCLCGRSLAGPCYTDGILAHSSKLIIFSSRVLMRYSSHIRVSCDIFSNYLEVFQVSLR